jgi:MFS family permease
MALGNWTERIVVGFFVLDQSGDVFLTAASFAVRQAPSVIAAPIAGRVADRWPRNRLLGITAIYKVAVLGTLSGLAASGMDAIWPVFIVTAFSGVGGSFEVPATQGLVTDSVPRKLRMNAVATQSIGSRAVGAAGGLASGFVIDNYGVPTALLVGVAAFVSAAVATLFIPVARRASPTTQPGTSEGLKLFVRAFKDLRALFGLPAVRWLLVAALVVEMFGFAYNAVLPSVAKDVLGQEGVGLGALSMAAGLGGLSGVVLLAALGDYQRKGLLLAGITVLYGTFLVAFASSGVFPLSLALIAVVGMMAGGFDAMQWTLLQESVPEDMRGRAIGGWVFAISFGWLGHLGLGALGEAVGVQWALGGAGALVLATGALMWLFVPGIRKPVQASAS